jgi:hypothetical protein
VKTIQGWLYADGPVPVKPIGDLAVVGAAITHPAFATRPVSAVLMV